MTTEHAQLASLVLRDVDGPLAFLQDRIGRCMQWQSSDWLEDAQTSELVIRLQSVEVLETKELLRPVFKWCKRGCEQQACIEKLSRSGDAELGLQQQPHITPAYAYNTIITSCQRGKAEQHARRAYIHMLQAGLAPDVFTHTAIIDILGRTGEVDDALR
eukprot:21495-Heterococcus_DN1.PRE.2